MIATPRKKSSRLLILTQKVDINDPILGFFVRWVEEFAKHCEQVTVICLEEGKHNFYSAKNAVPRSENSEEFSGTGVRVFSLGKKEVKSQKSKVKSLKKLKYIFNFFKIIWRERKNYDTVFVHMNQEYVLLGGLLWKTFGKKITMWRNHYAGSFLTDIAASLCDTVFCTSKYSYTAKYKKTVLMPVGIDTETFSSKVKGQRSKVKDSILFLARIAPSKKLHLLIEALRILRDDGVQFTADLYGDPDPKDAPYLESLKNKVKEYSLEDHVSFRGGVPHTATPSIYGSHTIFVNASPSGMYDKTIFEAMACESLILTSNRNLKGQIDNMFLFKEDDAHSLAQKLKTILNLDTDTQEKYGKILRNYVTERHSLKQLINAIIGIL